MNIEKRNTSAHTVMLAHTSHFCKFPTESGCKAEAQWLLRRAFPFYLSKFRWWCVFHVSYQTTHGPSWVKLLGNFLCFLFFFFVTSGACDVQCYGSLSWTRSCKRYFVEWLSVISRCGIEKVWCIAKTNESKNNIPKTYMMLTTFDDDDDNFHFILNVFVILIFTSHTCI